ncbi:MAG TPA: peptidase S10, partial [Gammaproteobacteria bacterium]|nr:peptidase S10 [Gammaproteobacteria bacterium]
MKRLLLLSSLLFALGTTVSAFAADAPAAGKPPAAAEKPVPKETHTVTHHSARIGGQSLDYTATVGNLLIRDDKGEPAASVFYIAYTRDGVKDAAKRPVTFLYNGGPGSSSIWLHMGAFGPMRVVTSDAQATPPPPYNLVSNPDSLLDKSDLVFIDAIGTGYSTPVGKHEGKDFWGVDQDVEAFGKFIRRYITVNNRWNSPKFLLGESYGTTRSANLVDWLQSNGIACNGVILVSSVLNYGDTMPGTNLGYVTYLPSFAAIAWQHNKVPNKPADLASFVQQAREFAMGEYQKALFEGSRLSQAEYNDVLTKLHRFTGLSEQYLKDANLRVSPSRFRAELLRGENRTVGRYDARFEGINFDNAEETPDYDASDTGISTAFTAAFHHYLQDDLDYRNELPYKVTNFQIIRSWDWTHSLPGRRSFRKPPLPDVAANLGDALR